MRIFIATIEDPLVTNDFIKEIMEAKKDEIVGISISEHGQFKTRKSRKDVNYVLALLIIAGVRATTKKVLKYLLVKVKKIIKAFRQDYDTGSIEDYARKLNIPVWKVSSLNDKEFIKTLRKLEPDVIIHQTEEIVKKDFINSANICVLNRHNSLLPKYRGRLAPFWALFNGEKETGVTIHTVDTKIDGGQIILQEKIMIKPDDDYVSITEKCYELAPKLMIRALELLENGIFQEREKKDVMGKGSYYSIPRLSDAIRYRKTLKKRKKRMGENESII